MQKTDTLYTAYVEVLKEELLPAMGCTEPMPLPMRRQRHGAF